VIYKGDVHHLSGEECSALAQQRECRNFDYIPSAINNPVNQCFLYECEICLLDFPYLNEGIVE
jgi:hypothetical protein